MKCAVCKSELVVGGQKRLETLAEHVFNPDGNVSLKDYYICKNVNCECSTLGIMWDQWGGCYYGKDYLASSKLKFIDNNNGAFGSFERQINVECSKNDEDKITPKIFGWQIKLKYKYKSNEDGDILSRKPRFALLHNGVLKLGKF